MAIQKTVPVKYGADHTTATATSPTGLGNIQSSRRRRVWLWLFGHLDGNPWSDGLRLHLHGNLHVRWRVVGRSGLAHHGAHHGHRWRHHVHCELVYRLIR
jgi:hypothetical protein